MAEKERPGVMLYFDLRPCLKRLSLQEKGLLFEAVMDYAQYGEVPLLDGMAGIAWDFIQPRIDRDAERYEEVSERRRQAAKKRWDKQEEEPQPDANECKSMQMDANAYFAMQTMPTTTTASTTTSTTNTTTTSTPSSTSTSTSIPSPSPRAGRQAASDRRAVDREMDFEALRQQKLRQLSEMIAGP